MALTAIREKIAICRRRAAYIFFAGLLIWPLIHIILVNNLRMSTWRLFGWGMYATPTPDAYRLRVVIGDNDVVQDEPKSLHASLMKLMSDSNDESLCVNLFREDDGLLHRLPRRGLCRDDAVAKNLDYFLHFSSAKHLKGFINEARIKPEHSSSPTYAFVTRQRFNLLESKAYVESDVYKITDEELLYLGRI